MTLPTKFTTPAELGEAGNSVEALLVVFAMKFNELYNLLVQIATKVDVTLSAIDGNGKPGIQKRLFTVEDAIGVLPELESSIMAINTSLNEIERAELIRTTQDNSDAVARSNANLERSKIEERRIRRNDALLVSLIILALTNVIAVLTK